MAKVNVAELEALEAKQLKTALETQIQEKTVAGKKLFKGPSLPDWFDDYGECILENGEAKRQVEYKRSGLDEFGRTPEQVEYSKEKAALLKKKQKLLEEALAIDIEIQRLKLPEVSEDEKPKAKKAKK